MADSGTEAPAPLAPLKEAVAEKTGIDPAIVAERLAEIGATDERSSRRADPLTVRRLNFGGTKRLTGLGDGPFSFEWNGLAPGLWAAVSDGTNQIGKSTIIEVMIWALRGRSRALRPEVRAWIESVELEFTIGADRYAIAFSDEGNVPRGRLMRLVPAPARIIDTFEGDEAFETLMGDMMMERFALQPIPNVNHRGEEASQYFHAWTAYAASMFIEGSHPAILGDVVTGALWWRMLHLFVGMPYAATHMALRNAVTLEQAKRERDGTQRARTAAYAGEIKRVEAEIEQRRRELARDATAAPSADEIEKLSADHGTLLRQLTGLQEQAEAAERTARILKAERDEGRAVLRRLRDGASSKRAFAGLKPVCCPRCAESFPDSRAAAEEAGGHCAVCDRDTLRDDQAGLQDAIAAAQDRVSTLTAAETQARGHLADVRRSIIEAEKQRSQVTARIRAIEQQAEAIRRRRLIEDRVLKLTGALEQLRKLDTAAPATPGESGDLLALYRAAETIAEQRMKKANAELLSELEGEVVAIARRCGFRGLEAISIRGNGITLTVSGVPSNYGQQTAGQRLRLRIALVVAMMRLAERSGFGHHPGLLFIDSPGSEELSDEDLVAMMTEIGQVARDMASLQIFLVSARGDLLGPAVPEGQLKTPLPNGMMF